MKHEVETVSLNSREWLVLLFGLAIVLSITLLSWRGWTAFGRREKQLEMTRRVVAGTGALLTSLTAAETGQRGFVLTGEDRYLEPYRKARADIAVLLESFGPVGRSHPDQARCIERLKPLIDEKLAALAVTIELRRSKGFDAALAVVRSNRGRVLMAQLRGICTEILTVANGRLIIYAEQARSSINRGDLVSVLGGARLFFLLLDATSAIQRGVARHQSLIGELQNAEAKFRRLLEAAPDAMVMGTFYPSRSATPGFRNGTILTQAIHVGRESDKATAALCRW